MRIHSTSYSSYLYHPAFSIVWSHFSPGSSLSDLQKLQDVDIFFETIQPPYRIQGSDIILIYSEPMTRQISCQAISTPQNFQVKCRSGLNLPSPRLVVVPTECRSNLLRLPLFHTWQWFRPSAVVVSDIFHHSIPGSGSDQMPQQSKTSSTLGSGSD